MAQKRRKNSLIVSFLCPLPLLREIDRAVQEQNERTRDMPISRSAWLLRAVRRDLDHRKR